MYLNSLYLIFFLMFNNELQFFFMPTTVSAETVKRNMLRAPTVHRPHRRVAAVQRAPPGTDDSIDDIGPPESGPPPPPFVPVLRPLGAPPMNPDSEVEEITEEIGQGPPPLLPPMQQKKRYSGYSYNKYEKPVYSPREYVRYWAPGYNNYNKPQPPPTYSEAGERPIEEIEEIIEIPTKPRHPGGYFGK